MKEKYANVTNNVIFWIWAFRFAFSQYNHVNRLCKQLDIFITIVLFYKFSLNFQERGRYLNTLERFHIYKAKKTGGLLNDNYIDTYNPVFESVC
jgi:hypothetical protein